MRIQCAAYKPASPNCPVPDPFSLHSLPAPRPVTVSMNTFPHSEGTSQPGKTDLGEKPSQALSPGFRVSLDVSTISFRQSCCVASPSLSNENEYICRYLLSEPLLTRLHPIKYKQRILLGHESQSFPNRPTATMTRTSWVRFLPALQNSKSTHLERNQGYVFSKSPRDFNTQLS